ncbi:bifunctional adenosylcobinamide kinase/adenosylcobinamide-phosphate guanylyltransferase, partial [Actinocatenispora comari]|uniref:bifunctional adenosylcobinamide kinase/adenosylcobinamide-phosphate guanylyltransferase n=1 Tax=Actinocatenispora comari TaxID=2807577 RepID=UPI001A92557A
AGAAPAAGTESPAADGDPAATAGTSGESTSPDGASSATGADPAGPPGTGAGAAATSATGAESAGGGAAAAAPAPTGGDARDALLADAPARLAAAVAACPAATIVLVSPEVGLSVVPASRTGRRFADLLGAINRAVADVSDRVALVVAGRTLWLPAAGDAAVPAAAVPA